MLKKVITYIDFDGNERTDIFYFNLNEVEVSEMQVSKAGGLGQYLERIVKEEDQEKLFAFFKELILKAYGEKSEDGKRFIKSFELREGFSQTNAFVKFFMELGSDANAAIEFVNGIIPQVKEKNN